MGQHNGLLAGPPGAGKTILARSIPSILPILTLEEAVEGTRIYSVNDLQPSNSPLTWHRPFRSPYHTISHAGLVCGERCPRSSEISFADRGVLFLDELPEFDSRSLEACVVGRDSNVRGRADGLHVAWFASQTLRQ